MSNYTVGEWVYEKTSTGIRKVYGASGEKKVIADISGLEDGIDNAARRIEANANAQLISAAPDLLAACEHGAMSSHHSSCSHGKRGDGNTCECHVGKCQKAIAKAN